MACRYQTFEDDVAAEAEKVFSSAYYEEMAASCADRIPDFKSRYTAEDCFYDYKIGLIQWVSVVASYCYTLLTSDPNLPKRNLELICIMLRRGIAAWERNNCLAVVEDMLSQPGE